MQRKADGTWKTEQATFPTRLNELMQERGVSQEKLARALGIKRQTVSLYKTGQSSPDVEKLSLIAEFFNVSSDWLLGLSDFRNYENRGVTASSLGMTDESAKKQSSYWGWLDGVSPEDMEIGVKRYFPYIWNEFLSSDAFLDFLREIGNYVESAIKETLFEKSTLPFTVYNPFGFPIEIATEEDRQRNLPKHPLKESVTAWRLERSIMQWIDSIAQKKADEILNKQEKDGILYSGMQEKGPFESKQDFANRIFATVEDVLKDDPRLKQLKDSGLLSYPDGERIKGGE